MTDKYDAICEGCENPVLSIDVQAYGEIESIKFKCGSCGEYTRYKKVERRSSTLHKIDPNQKLLTELEPDEQPEAEPVRVKERRSRRK